MPVGVNCGHLVTEMRSQFLLWWTSQDRLREKYPDTIAAALAELRTRFERPGVIEAELAAPSTVDAPDLASDLI
jgi:hypothetical protein